MVLRDLVIRDPVLRDPVLRDLVIRDPVLLVELGMEFYTYEIRTSERDIHGTYKCTMYNVLYIVRYPSAVVASAAARAARQWLGLRCNGWDCDAQGVHRSAVTCDL